MASDTELLKMESSATLQDQNVVSPSETYTHAKNNSNTIKNNSNTSISTTTLDDKNQDLQLTENFSKLTTTKNSCSDNEKFSNSDRSENNLEEIHDDDDFDDPKSIEAPKSLKELVARLHKIFAQDKINIEYVKALMESYKSNPKEWKKFAKFDPYRYTRNLVDEGNGKFNLMVLCWNEAQGSSIHSHAGSHCFLKVLSGQSKEEMYEWPDSDALLESHKETGFTEIGHDNEHYDTMKVKEEHYYKADQCTYINDDLGLHRVENPSHSDKSVTLHLYSPPFDECFCFDQRTGRKTTSKVTFWSKYGRRTPFGKNPAKIETEKENN